MEDINERKISEGGVSEVEEANRGNLYIAYSKDGDVKDIFFAREFGEAYEKTIAKDKDTYLLEVDINSLKDYLINRINKESKKKGEKMKKYLVCSSDGYVEKVIEAQTYEEAYDETIAQNNGEILIEIDEETENKLTNDRYRRERIEEAEQITYRLSVLLNEMGKELKALFEELKEA